LNVLVGRDRENGEGAEIMSGDGLLTVTYHAENGMTFTLSNVNWYEMQEAFNELSRQAYENGTSVKFVVVS